jgi:tRNA U54 and U55 pseudouridine synthase Pus10
MRLDMEAVEKPEERPGSQQRKRASTWKRPQRVRAEDGSMNLVGPAVKERRLTLRRNRSEFIKELSNTTQGRWSPSVADLLNIERQTRTVTDIELVAIAKALKVSVEALFAV